jgi:hypothetical protein
MPESGEKRWGRERRKFIRHPLSYPLKTTMLRSNTCLKEVVGESQNIGAGGLLFFSESPIDLGSEVDIELNVEGKKYQIDGTVVRCAEKIKGEYFSIAVAFHEPSELLKARMMEQVVRIELFKNRLERRYSVRLDFASVAKEWIRRYSKLFARRYDV